MSLQYLYIPLSFNYAFTDVTHVAIDTNIPTPLQMLPFELCIGNNLDVHFPLNPQGLNCHYFQKQSKMQIRQITAYSSTLGQSISDELGPAKWDELLDVVDI